MKHRHTYKFADTGCEDTKTGICLCANHHLMYDHDLPDIDFETLEISIMNEQLKAMLWYREFVNKYQGTVLDRDDSF